MTFFFPRKSLSFIFFRGVPLPAASPVAVSSKSGASSPTDSFHTGRFGGAAIDPSFRGGPHTETSCPRAKECGQNRWSATIFDAHGPGGSRKKRGPRSLMNPRCDGLGGKRRNRVNERD